MQRLWPKNTQPKARMLVVFSVSPLSGDALNNPKPSTMSAHRLLEFNTWGHGNRSWS